MSTLIDVREDETYKRVAESVSDAAEAAKAIGEVNGSEDITRANGILVTLTDAKKTADAARKELGDPYHRTHKAILAEFKELTSPLEGAIAAIKAQIAAHHRREREKAAAAAREAEEKARKEAEERAKAEEDAKFLADLRGEAEPEPEPAPEPPPPPPPAPAKTAKVNGGGAVTNRTVWKHEVTAPADVPREFLKVDEQAIRAAVRSGVREIPGVWIYEDVEVGVRS